MASNEIQTEEELEAALLVLEAWQWDGRAMSDITDRLGMIDIHLPHKRKEWVHTVPADCRGKVTYVQSQNPLNSEEQIRRSAEILAVDEAGNALVCKTYYNTYTDDELPENLVMPIDKAKALVEECRKTKEYNEMMAELAVEVEEEEPAANHRRLGM